MVRYLCIAALLSIGFIAPGYAQTNTTSAANQSVNVLAYAGGGTNGGNGNNGYSGREDIHEHYSGIGLNGSAVPSSMLISGANPCLIGTGGSAVGGPFGLSLSIGKSDESCNRRQDTGVLVALGAQIGAFALSCQNRKIADAIYSAYGAACLGKQNDPRYKDATYRFVTIMPTDGLMDHASLRMIPVSAPAAHS